MDDQKKVAPGPAMSKLMLLELYEVEAKDGDRHDHVVSRGKAKQRLEALRTLPEHLFFIVFNIQLPGDPPISIVSYFAVPLDLMEKYPSRATAKFLDMFEKFVDAPRTERQRLAAWGVTVPPEDNNEINGEEGTGEAESHDDTEGLNHTNNSDDNNTPTAEIQSTSTGTADKSSHHHPPPAVSSSSSSTNSSGKTKETITGVTVAVPGRDEGKQLTNGSSHAHGQNAQHVVSPTSTTAANSSGSSSGGNGLKSSLFTAITCSSYLSSTSPSASRDPTPEKRRSSSITSGFINHTHTTNNTNNNTTTQPPSSSTNSHPLSKIGQAKKIVREAAALGGGGLRRLQHYVIGSGGGSHHDTTTATSPPGDFLLTSFLTSFLTPFLPPPSLLSSLLF